MSGRTAIVLGATGLVGSFLTNQLLEEEQYEKVVLIHRRKLDLHHRKIEQVVINFNDIEDVATAFQQDHLFICLGTTIKKAGSEENFRKVDYDYVVNSAKLAAAQGVERLMVVSSIGANADSKLFYPRVKGEMEQAVSNMGFSATGIFRPSFLDGPREESRPGEKAGILLSKAFSFLMVGPFKKYKPIHVSKVAAAMIKFALSDNKGVHVLESDEIAAMGE